MRTLVLWIGWLGWASVAVGQVQSAEGRFWGWFAQHRQPLKEALGDSALQAVLYPQVVTALRQVHPGLTFELAELPDGRAQLVLSADGIREIFPQVQTLLAAMPPGGWDGWNVVAFRPRIGTSYSITINGLELAPADIWFRAAPNDDGKVQLQYYVRGWHPSRAATLRTAVEVLTDAALGEYDAHTKLADQDFFPLPLNPRRYGLLPFDDLPSTVDRLTR